MVQNNAHMDARNDGGWGLGVIVGNYCNNQIWTCIDFNEYLKEYTYTWPEKIIKKYKYTRANKVFKCFVLYKALE